MSEYIVRVPFAGVISFAVEADSEKVAIAKAMGDSNLRIKLTTMDGGEPESAEVEEWDMFRVMVEGSTVYAPLWQAEAEEL